MKNTKCDYGWQPQPFELGATKTGETVAALRFCGAEQFKAARRPERS